MPHPETPALSSRQTEQDITRITLACRHIDTCETLPTLHELAALSGLSPHHFHRVFRRITGMTPKQYAEIKRTQRLQEQLATQPTVTLAAMTSGYNSNSRFYDNIQRRLGMPPKTFQRGGDGIRIHFAVGQCSLGEILVAQSERGICAILFGDDAETLLRELQDRFSHAELVGGDDNFEKTVAYVIAFVDQPDGTLNLPLDIRGTAFQQRVWQALRDIPPGNTVSYAQLANQLGMPGSARAVAGACAANAIAVAIPCHRVVRNDGAISGYRWGVERKRALLEREARLASG